MMRQPPKTAAERSARAAAVMYRWSALCDDLALSAAATEQILTRVALSPRPPRLCKNSTVFDERDALRWCSESWEVQYSSSAMIEIVQTVTMLICGSAILEPIYKEDPVAALLSWGFSLPKCVHDHEAGASALQAALNSAEAVREHELITFWQRAQDLDEAIFVVLSARDLETLVAGQTLLLCRLARLTSSDYHHLKVFEWALKRSMIGLGQAHAGDRAPV